MQNDIQIKKNIASILSQIKKINKDAILVAITKFVSIEKILIAFDSSITHFGESRIQEAKEKLDFFNKIKDRINLHFIGHLQSNKVNKAIDYFDYIQSVDSFSIAQKISNSAEKINKIINIFLEIKISNEESKYGFLMDEIWKIVNDLQKLQNIKINGLMAIAPYFENPEETRPYFKKMKKLFDEIKKMNLKNFDMKYISMGMSNDYIIALEEGANMVRIGTAIFGKRE